MDWFDIPLPEIIDNQYGEFLILLGIWVLIGVMTLLVLRPVVHSIFAKTETDVDDKIIEILDAPLILLVFVYGAVQSLRVLDIIPGDFHTRILTLYRFIVSFIVVYLGYRIFRVVFIPLGTEYARKKDSDIDKTILPVVDTIGGTLIILVGMFWILTVLGVNVTVFLAGIGVAGLVLAFALQDTLSNYFSGLHLLLDSPFKVGDTLKVDGEFMKVRAIGFRSTRLYHIHAHEVVIMPNNVIANQKLVNLTEPDNEYRLQMIVSVAYGSPVPLVKEILMEAVKAQKEVIMDVPKKKPTVRLRKFGESALEFRTRFFIKNVLHQWRILGDVREHVERRFREEGITIPFPQRTISYLDGGLDEDAPAPAPSPSA
jgi:small-conductance mechanosensitive channel